MPTPPLGREEERFRYVALATGDAVYDWDVRSGEVWRNDAYHARYGVDGAVDADGSLWEPRVHPDDRDALVASIRDAFRQRSRYWTGEYRLLGVDGAYASVVARGHVLYDEEGRAVRMVGAVVDVTERKRAEEAHRDLLEHSLQGVFVVQDMRIVFANRAGAAVFGYSVDEMLAFSGEEVLALVRPENRTEIRERIRDRLVGGPPMRFEYAVVRRDGELRWTDVSSVRIEYRGRPAVQVTIVDVTDRRRAEQTSQDHLWFLECMDRINRAIQGTSDLEQMMSDVLDEVLAIFDCDRVWLVFPCDPTAPSYQVPMERTRPEYPGALALNLEVPMDPVSARTIQLLLEADGPVRFDPGDVPVSEEWADRLSIRSQLAMAIYPKTSKPYAFGLHQCSRARYWTALEERVLLEIGRRLADALSSLLAYRDLRDSEARLAEAERIAHVGYWDLDVDSSRITWSDEAYRIVALPPQEGIIDLARFLEIVHPDDRAAIADVAAAALAGGPRFEADFRVVRPDGEVRYVHSRGDLKRDERGRPRRLFGTVQDVTARVRAEQALRENEHFLQAIIDNSTAVIYVKDFQGRFLLVNRRFEELFHVDRGSAAGKTDYDFFPADRADAFRAFDRRVLEAGEARESEEVVPHDDGLLHTYISVKCPLLDADGSPYAVCGISTDITERKRIEEETRVSLREKEALLKEVHHRVKNNLQIISSLLALQSRHVADPAMQGILAESQSRVRSMALVHEALYRSPSLADVELSPYVESLCAHLYRSYGIDSRRITLRAAVPDITLDLDRAIPCGLLIHELVSNALKHAFPGDRPGTISIEFVAAPDVAYRLAVADDGVGLPPDLDLADAPSLGLQLVSGLTDQIRGTLDVDAAPGRGTRFAISFPR